MKRFLLSLFSMVSIFVMGQVQNDTMYIMKNGLLVGKFNVLSEVDSIIFYNPFVAESSNLDGVSSKRRQVLGELDIENAAFLDMATRAANYIDNNSKLPLTITTPSGTLKVNTAEFYYMMARWIRWFKNNGEDADPPTYVTVVRDINGPPNPSGTESGTINKADILTKGKSNADFIGTNNYVPNFTTVGSTQYTPESFFYVMARTIRWYAQNNSFPAYATVWEVAAPGTWTSSTDMTDDNVENSKVLDMAIRAANYIDNNSKIPDIIYTDESQTRSTTAAEFYYMMARWLRWFENNGEDADPPAYVTIIETGCPPYPSGVGNGTISKSNMLAKGKSNADFIGTNNYVPNFTTIGSTEYSPVAMFYAMAKTIRWYAQHSNTFPNTVTVTQVTKPDGWPAVTPPSPTYPWSKTLSVPYTAQPDGYTCGPTSLRMTMAYYGTWRTVSEISSYMANSIGDSPYYDGVAPSTIVAAAKHYGFSSTVTQYGWDNLKNAIAAGHPVIANIQISANNYPRYYPSNSPAYTSYSGGHFVVVVGLQANTDGTIQYVVVNDPSRGNVKYTYSSFETSWVNNKNRLLIRLQ
jgi:predicted double-glycine peptidase